MAAIEVLAYWPFDLVNTIKARTFAYTDKTNTVAPFSSIFYYDSSYEQLVCADHDENNVWKDDWRLVYDPSRGVCEVSDWYPQSNMLLANIFGSIQKENLSTPIEWGNQVSIGQTISNTPVYDPFTSTPLFCVSGSGFQAVTFEALLPSLGLANGVIYNNVLQMFYEQTWNGKTQGARYWLAKGVGPIAISWANCTNPANPIFEPRCDAVITTSLIWGAGPG